MLIAHQEERSKFAILTIWNSDNTMERMEYCIANRYIVPREILYPIFFSKEKDDGLKVSITYKEIGTLHIIQNAISTVILPRQIPVIINGIRQNNRTQVLLILSTILSNI